MGAPTGSLEVWMEIEPRERGCFAWSSAKPVMVRVAGRLTERFLMAAQVSASGFQVQDAASWGVSLGGSLLSAIQRGSISPMRGRCPLDTAWRAAEPSANATSMRQKRAAGAASRHMNVGATMSGGKMD